MRFCVKIFIFDKHKQEENFEGIIYEKTVNPKDVNPSQIMDLDKDKIGLSKKITCPLKFISIEEILNDENDKVISCNGNGCKMSYLGYQEFYLYRVKIMKQTVFLDNIEKKKDINIITENNLNICPNAPECNGKIAQEIINEFKL